MIRIFFTVNSDNELHCIDFSGNARVVELENEIKNKFPKAKHINIIRMFKLW